MSARKGDWMQTAAGRAFWPLDPRTEEVNADDIAHALSHQCRFAGHVREFYSVAEHCVRVSVLIEKLGGCAWEQLAGLLHDASEAYLVDLPTPVKRSMPDYDRFEREVEACVEERFGLPPGSIRSAIVKDADLVMLATEKRDLMGGERGGKWMVLPEPDKDVIEPWGCAHGPRFAFLMRLAQLNGRLAQ